MIIQRLHRINSSARALNLPHVLNVTARASTARCTWRRKANLRTSHYFRLNILTDVSSSKDNQLVMASLGLTTAMVRDNAGPAHSTRPERIGKGQ